MLFGLAITTIFLKAPLVFEHDTKTCPSIHCVATTSFCTTSIFLRGICHGSPACKKIRLLSLVDAFVMKWLTLAVRKNRLSRCHDQIEKHVLYSAHGGKWCIQFRYLLQPIVLNHFYCHLKQDLGTSEDLCNFFHLCLFNASALLVMLQGVKFMWIFLHIYVHHLHDCQSNFHFLAQTKFHISNHISKIVI